MERLSDIVKCLICGYEMSGTTVLSELIRHHPAIDGRFEIGFFCSKISRNIKNLFIESF